MKLTAYVLDGHSIDLRPAPADRPWMDATHERYAYRCLPLTIANAHGWEILCAEGLTGPGTFSLARNRIRRAQLLTANIRSDRITSRA